MTGEQISTIIAVVYFVILLATVGGISSTVSNLAKRRLVINPIVSRQGWHVDVRYENYDKPLVIFFKEGNQDGVWGSKERVELHICVYERSETSTGYASKLLAEKKILLAKSYSTYY